MSNPITFTLDDREVTAEPGESIWQAAKCVGTRIPHLFRLGQPALSCAS